MQRSILLYAKGVALVLALGLLLYPAVLLVQLATDTLAAPPSVVALLLVASLCAWVGVVRIYRRAEFGVGVRMKE